MRPHEPLIYRTYFSTLMVALAFLWLTIRAYDWVDFHPKHSFRSIEFRANDLLSLLPSPLHIQ